MSNESNRNESKQPDRQELEIARLIDGELKGLEPDQLAELLESNADLRKTYLEHVAMQAMLRWSHGVAGEQIVEGVNPAVILELLEEAEEVDRRRAAEEEAERAKEEAANAARRSEIEALQRRRLNRRPEPIVIPWSVVYAAVGTVAAAIVMLVHSSWPVSQVPQVAQTVPAPITAPAATPAAGPVATIIGSTDSLWGDPELSDSPGTRLPVGPLELVRGFVEIVFNDGAKVVIESPATLELLASDRMRLTQGKLVGNVPKSAIGFAVETPLATIVDLGTEFGIAIGEQDAADVHVFEGEVEAVVGGSDQRVSLTKDRSVRVSLVDGQPKIADVPIDPNQFARKLPDMPAYVAAVREANPIIYWRFEASPRGTVPNEMGDAFHGTIYAGNTGSTGLQEGVVHFNSSNSGLVVLCEDQREIPIRDDYSIECWMKPNQEHKGAVVSLGVPSNDPIRPLFHGVLLEFGGPEAPAATPEVVMNRPGHVRFLHRNPPAYREGTSCFSSRRYEVGRWQHVVAVKEGAELRLYIDGQLSGQADDPSAPPSGLQLHVGQLYRETPVERSFDGELDELAIYDHALSTKEIGEHFELGRPNSRLGGANEL